MTYQELYDKALWDLELGKINLGEFEDMIEPLNKEIPKEEQTDGDLISRQAVNKLRKYNLVGGVHTVSLDDINKLPSAEKTAEWISVSERLPEIQNYSDNYLVTLKRGGVHIAMFTECDGKHWWTYDDVMAWMPLPEPYKAE